jgi:ApaG protein
MCESEKSTRGIRIQAQSSYLQEHSDPQNRQWFFAYTINIYNESESTVQLLSRHWIITDSDGEVQEVKGEGVVGEQPVIPPGDSYQYTSFCPLETSFGTMHGSYQMVTSEGEKFDAFIPPFSLTTPNTIN